MYRQNRLGNRRRRGRPRSRNIAIPETVLTRVTSGGGESKLIGVKRKAPQEFVETPDTKTLKKLHPTQKRDALKHPVKGTPATAFIGSVLGRLGDIVTYKSLDAGHKVQVESLIRQAERKKSKLKDTPVKDAGVNLLKDALRMGVDDGKGNLKYADSDVEYIQTAMDQLQDAHNVVVHPMGPSPQKSVASVKAAAQKKITF